MKYKDNEKFKLEAGHGLVQLTATLRNLADLPNTRQKFLALNLIEQLVNVLKYYTSDGELMLNVSRILRFDYILMYNFYKNQDSFNLRRFLV